MKGFGFKNKTRDLPKIKVGLDAGNNDVKIVAISEGADRPKLIGLGTRKIAGLSKEEISDAIKACAEEVKIPLASEVNISISGPTVIARLISLPRMNDEELNNAIMFEAEKFVPFNISDCVIDFQVIKKNEKENKFNVLFVAARRDHIDERISLAARAGFSVGVVDVDSFAMANSFFRNFPNIDPAKTVALLNIGAAYTNLIIETGTLLSFVRDVAIGTNNFDAAIAKNTGLKEKPEETTVEKTAVSDKDKSDEILSFTKPVMNNLLDELGLSFSYLENQSGRSIDEIYISGGGADIPGLDEAFQDVFGTKPCRWDPLQLLDAASAGSNLEGKDKIKNSFAVAVGLALR